MTRRLFVPSASLFLLAFVVSCGETSNERAASVEPRSAGAVGGAESQAPPVVAPDAAPPRVRYDLASQVARAELRHGDALVVDLGVPSGHKYTLGRWRTRVGADHDFDGTSASVIESVTGFTVLPIESTARCHVSLRVRGFRDHELALYLDDETIGNAHAPTDGSWAVVEADIPPALCTVGEHELRLRVPSVGSAPGVGRAGVAIDWIRLSASATGAGIGPPAPSALTFGSGDERGLTIPDGWTLAYSFEVPRGARLRGIRSGAGRVGLRVERDGAPPQEIALPAGEGDTPFDVDLSSYAPHVVRLSFTARGDARLVRPAVVTLDREALRPPRRMRNVLIYLTDTLRADHLTPYAPDTRVSTPGLVAWARQASVFLAGHSQETWTKPSCATLLSGLFPWEHHATGEDSQVPQSVELISERLRAEGFHTGAFIANGFVSDRFGFEQGFRTFHNYVREGRRNMARFVAADVLAWLDDRPTDRPFFLYVHTIDPHVPYIPPAEDTARYDPEPYTGVVDFHRDRTLLEGVKGGRIQLNARDRLHLEALYDGEITYHDRHFASVMEALERRGLADDTLVVFTSDHGEEFFDHGSVGHGHSVYEELIRVPLIVRWPGVTDAAAPIEEAVGLIDVMPTALDALGLEIPETLSGRSVAPLLRGGSEDAPRPTVTGFMEGWRTVVVGRYKLIHRTTTRWMLHDLQADPGEQRDLAEERPIATRYLRGLLGLSLAEVERPRGAEVEHESAQTRIDDTLRQQLEALGYTGASRAPTAAEADGQDEPEED